MLGQEPQDPYQPCTFTPIPCNTPFRAEAKTYESMLCIHYRVPTAGAQNLQQSPGSWAGCMYVSSQTSRFMAGFRRVRAKNTGSAASMTSILQILGEHMLE